MIFLVGSVLSGISQTMGQLIAFRAVQGIGGGGLMIGAQAIVGATHDSSDRPCRSPALVGSAVATIARSSAEQHPEQERADDDQNASLTELERGCDRGVLTGISSR